jgi:AcrR family transcriptional regulator
MTTAEPRSASIYTGKTDKAGRTRARILETALAQVRERGYDGATMRAIAAEAGVSPGNAYYYFPSKEHLIQAFYARSHAEHLAVCEPLLARERKLEERLLGVLRAKFDTSRGDHRFAAALFKTAADPSSPLSPFSAESAPVRDEATQLMAQVVEGAASLRVETALAAELPTLLWLYQMGLILFWIHDDSPEQARSYRLMERTAKIVCRLIRLAGLAPMRPLVRSTVSLIRELREDEPAPPVPPNAD